MNNENPIALIYARVSTKKQDPKSQILRCEQYCNQREYNIEKVFEDKFTGGGNFLDRPAMGELLQYAKKNIHKKYIVVFDDLKRFARDTKFHIELRSTFAASGLTPECLNYNFDDSPEGRFAEVIFAAQNELERCQNRRQVIQKQRIRLMAGYNAFVPPTGYKKIKKDPLHGTIDVTDHKASAMKKALKMFAYGELQSRIDVAVFLKKKGVLGKQEPHRYLETVKKFLTNVFYAGYIQYEPWDVQRRKGHHKPLITLDEYNRIQRRLSGTDHSYPIRRDINPIYPLRGLINCYYCKEKFTACKSKGRWGGLYHKYYCNNKECPLRGMQSIKSVSSDDLHDQFKTLLESLRPSIEILRATHQAYQKTIDLQIAAAKTSENEKEKEKQKIEGEIDILISHLTDAKTSDILRKQYEKKITELAQKIEKIETFLLRESITENHFRTPCKKMFEMLENPYEIWSKSDIIQKRKLFYFLFEENLEYHPGEGFRTPKKALPIRLFEQFSACSTDYVKIPRKTSNPLQEYIIKWNTQIRPMLDDKNQ